MMGLVGWTKHPNPAETDQPMGDLLESSSGLYFNDEHPLLTIENLRRIADTFSEYTYSAYNAGTTYSKGDMVTSGGNYYASVVDSNTGNLVTDTDYWRETSPFNEWLRKRTLAGIRKFFADWTHTKAELGTIKTLLKRSQVLHFPGYDAPEIPATTKDWIGWRIVPSPYPDVVLTIDRVALHLRDGQNVTLRLYKDGSTTATATQVVTATGNGVFWAEPGWVLERGSFYYVAYDRSGLTAKVLNSIDNMERHNWYYDRFPGVLPYAEISAFQHDGPGDSTWADLTDYQTNTSNFGLNMMISAKCDYTSLLIDHKKLFASPIAKAVAIVCLKELAANANANINRHQANIDPARVYYEIEGDTIGRNGGLKKDYMDATKLVALDSSKFSKHCMPCRSKSIRQRTIG